jgi:hypothetical protein
MNGTVKDAVWYILVETFRYQESYLLGFQAHSIVALFQVKQKFNI